MKWVIIGSGTLSLWLMNTHQDITWTNVDFFSPFQFHLDEKNIQLNMNQNTKVFFQQNAFKMSSARGQPLCSALNELKEGVNMHTTAFFHCMPSNRDPLTRKL